MKLFPGLTAVALCLFAACAPQTVPGPEDGEFSVKEQPSVPDPPKQKPGKPSGEMEYGCLPAVAPPNLHMTIFEPSLTADVVRSGGFLRISNHSDQPLCFWEMVLTDSDPDQGRTISVVEYRERVQNPASYAQVDMRPFAQKVVALQIDYALARNLQTPEWRRWAEGGGWCPGILVEPGSSRDIAFMQQGAPWGVNVKPLILNKLVATLQPFGGEDRSRHWCNYGRFYLKELP